jgi:hypothetical protein
LVVKNLVFAVLSSIDSSGKAFKSTVQHAPPAEAASLAAKTHLWLKHLPLRGAAPSCGELGVDAALWRQLGVLV